VPIFRLLMLFTLTWTWPIVTVADPVELRVSAKQINGFVDTPHSGHLIESLRWIEAHSDFRFHIVVLPPVRAIRTFEQQSFDILLPVPEVSDSNSVSLYQRRVFLFYRDDHSPLDSLDDLEGQSLALVEGFTYDRDAISQRASIQRVTSNEIAVRMVIQGRVDAMLGEEQSILAMARRIGTDRLRYQANAPISETGVYLRFADTLDSTIQEQLNQWLIRYQEMTDDTATN